MPDISGAPAWVKETKTIRQPNTFRGNSGTNDLLMSNLGTSLTFTETDNNAVYYNAANVFAQNQ